VHSVTCFEEDVIPKPDFVFKHFLCVYKRPGLDHFLKTVFEHYHFGVLQKKIMFLLYYNIF
jgi:hypothetical protein